MPMLSFSQIRFSLNRSCQRPTLTYLLPYGWVANHGRWAEDVRELLTARTKHVHRASKPLSRQFVALFDFYLIMTMASVGSEITRPTWSTMAADPVFARLHVYPPIWSAWSCARMQGRGLINH